jgi:hypothetical protein
VKVAEEEDDAETWEDAMDEMEDVWMREPTGLKLITAAIMLFQQLLFCLIFAKCSLQ